MKRELCLLLSLIFLVCSFTGCTEQEEKLTETTVAPVTAQPTTAPPETTAPPLADDLAAMGLPYTEEGWFALLTDGLSGTIYLDEAEYGTLALILMLEGDILEKGTLTGATLSTDLGGTLSIQHKKNGLYNISQSS